MEINREQTLSIFCELVIANGEEVKIGVPFVDGGVIKAEGAGRDPPERPGRAPVPAICP